MRAVSVPTIILRARRWADYEGNNHVTDEEILDYINEEWPRQYALYAKAYPDMFRTELEFAADGNAEGEYVLPATHFATIGVDRKEGRRFVRLRRLLEQERNRYSGETGQRARKFRVIRDSLFLYPPPPNGAVYKHIYLPTAGTVTVSDSIDGILGHEKLLELEIALRILVKENSDISQLLILRDQARREIEEEAAMRQAEEMVYPVDEYEDDDDEGSFRRSPP